MDLMASRGCFASRLDVKDSFLWSCLRSGLVLLRVLEGGLGLFRHVLVHHRVLLTSFAVCVEPRPALLIWPPTTLLP